MHRHHLRKQTEAHRQVPSFGWQVDSEMMSLAPTVVCASVYVRGGSYLVHTDTHTCYVTPCSLQCDISHSANWSDSYSVITDFDVWQDKSNYSYSKPMLCLCCRSDPRGCSVFFLIPPTTAVCRREFLSDSVDDKRSELVTTVPWVGDWLLWNIQMSLFNLSSSPSSLPAPTPSPYVPGCHSVSLTPLSKLPVFIFLSRFLYISHCRFLFSCHFLPSIFVTLMLVLAYTWPNCPQMLTDCLECGCVSVFMQRVFISRIYCV